MEGTNTTENYESKGKQPKYSNIIGPAMMMSFFSFINIGITIIYQMLVARQFGAKSEMDAYLTVLVIPKWLEGVFLVSLNFAFIPTFIEYIKSGNEADAWKIATTIFKLFTIILTFFCVLGMIFAPEVIRLTAPGFQGDTFWLAVRLLRITFPSMIFMGVFGLLSSLHFSYQKFLLPSIAPIIYILINIIIFWLFSPTWGISSIALGTTLGQLSQVIVVVSILNKSKNNLLSFSFNHPGVIKVIKLVTP
jgi:putative peptidoglycan lipid II flippase